MDQVVSLSDHLLEWCSVADFRSIVKRLDSLIRQSPRSGITPHRQRQFGPWREAWVLSRALETLGATRVRLVAQGAGSADAEVDTGSEILQIEITEAIEKDWLPNVPPPDGPRSDGGPAEWRARAAAVPELLEAAGRRKQGKPYASRAVLLVYLNNGGTYEIADDEIEASIRAFIRRFTGTFRRVHVLWGETVF